MDLRFALLLACFFFSGFAALLYQTVWSRELSFVFGTSDLAVSAVLAAYMGGLALGSAAAARLTGRIRRPVLAYGVLELAIAVCALAVPWAIELLDVVYVALVGGREVLADGAPAAATLFQLAGAFAVLLPPTAFMGATLPLLARHAVHREEEIGTRVGGLYAVNTAGAIGGTVVAAFWLMPELGLRQTVWVGAGLNAVVFGLAVLLARRAPLAEPVAAAHDPGETAEGAFWVLPAILVSGAVSFSYEVLWTRLLGHLLGASIHAFATMLASFLLGIALGSAVAARLARSRAQAAFGFGVAQLGIAATSYAGFALSEWLPDLSRSLGAGPAAPLASAAVAGAALLPVTLCIGATFPFAVRVLARSPERAAAATARCYAWNTVGAIVGALGAGFLLLPELGFEGTLAVGITLSLALAALTALASLPRRLPLAAAAGVSLLALVVFPPATPWRIINASSFLEQERVGQRIFAAVGRTTTVTVHEARGRYYVATNGLPEAAVDAVGIPPRISVAHWLGALPAWIRPEARSALVVGLGGGVALELIPSSYDSIDVIELEPEVLAANRRLSPLRHRDPLADPRVEVRIGDARGTLQLTRRRFDAIVSQPSHPWTAGASHLYTREFFDLVRSRLEPDGVFVQWIGIRFADEALLRALLAALAEAFPHVGFFQPQPGGLLFAASAQPLEPLEGVQRVLREAPEALAEYGIYSLEDFAARWSLDDSGVRALAQGARPNTDDFNQLAARSGALGDRSLTVPAIRELVAPYDPLHGVEGLDRVDLVRTLSLSNQLPRAEDLTTRYDGFEEAASRGWIEIGQRRKTRAAVHFARALELEPGEPRAVEGLIIARQMALSRGDPVPELNREWLAPRHLALIEGSRAARRDDWEAVEMRDAALARFSPGEALYDVAARLRVEWRLRRDREPEEAQRIAGTLLPNQSQPQDLLLHARASLAAGSPVDCWGSLQAVIHRILEMPPSYARHARGLASRVMQVAQGLPDERQASLRRQLPRGQPPGGLRRGQGSGPGTPASG